MRVRAVLTRLLPGDGLEVVVECRRCGTTLSSEADGCPACGSSDLCRYEIPE